MNTAQTSGMTRAVAINHAMTGAKKLWAGTVTVEAGVAAGAHHHGELESIIYIIKGNARFRWGVSLEFFADAGPGDFIYVPPFVPHQEINPGDEPVEVVLVRSDQEPIVVSLDIPATDSPQEDRWDSGFHQRPWIIGNTANYLEQILFGVNLGQRRCHFGYQIVSPGWMIHKGGSTTTRCGRTRQNATVCESAN